MTSEYDFTAFTNVEITGVDIASFNSEEQSALYAQARYCQAMTDADTDTSSTTFGSTGLSEEGRK